MPNSILRFVPSSLTPRRRDRLVRQLQRACESLDAWEKSIRNAVATCEKKAVVPPAEANELLKLLADAKRCLIRRLSELGVSEAAATGRQHDGVRESPARTAGVATLSPYSLCVSASRACGRALGAAFREAQSVADIASASILYAPLRAFEKLIWMLDPRQAS